jgi:hypothetical protein
MHQRTKTTATSSKPPLQLRTPRVSLAAWTVHNLFQRNTLHHSSTASLSQSALAAPVLALLSPPANSSRSLSTNILQPSPHTQTKTITGQQTQWYVHTPLLHREGIKGTWINGHVSVGANSAAAPGKHALCQGTREEDGKARGDNQEARAPEVAH